MIKRFSNNGNLITSWGGARTGSEKFDMPWDVVLDAQDHEYIPGCGNNTI
jgi:hypothetical protein